MKRSKIIDCHGKPHILTIKADLVHLKGNARPYFSITGVLTDAASKREVMWGRFDDDIIAAWPDLAPLVALSGSTDDGIPMHAEANGWYWLAGAAGGLQQQFHGGNSNPPRDREQCIAILADHVRVSVEQARALVEQVKNMASAWSPREDGVKAARAMFGKWVDAQGPRWAEEAKAAIEDFSLTVEVR